MMDLKKRIKDGTRDYIFYDAKLKRQIMNNLTSLFESNGYCEIITPSFEYYDVFNHNGDCARDEEIYKFTDEKNRRLALRADCTMPIARIAATKLNGEALPYKMFYCQNKFNAYSEDNHSLLEVTQGGVEYIGADNTTEADLNILKLAVMSLRSFFKEDFKIEVGHGKLFGLLVDIYNINSVVAERARKLIERKNFAALESMDLPYAFKMLPKIFGQMNSCEDLNELTKFEETVGDERVSGILSYLGSIFKELSNCGYGKYLSFDLGMVHRLDYYTGIIFDGFVYGSGQTVLSGGRYDNLIAEFGRDLNAVGFGLNVDEIFDIVKSNKREDGIR